MPTTLMNGKQNKGFIIPQFSNSPNHITLFIPVLGNECVVLKIPISTSVKKLPCRQRKGKIPIFEMIRCLSLQLDLKSRHCSDYPST